MKLQCNGICLTGYDIGVPYSGIAYPHPDCELHGAPMRMDDWDYLYERWLEGQETS
jgi:hypothetical protein